MNNIAAVISLPERPVPPVVVQLLGPPVAYARSRINRKTGIIFTPSAQRNSMAALRLAAGAEMTDRLPFAGPVRLDLTATFAVPRSWSKKQQAAAIAGTVKPAKRPDLSNLLKLAEDALNGVVFTDDCLIVEVVARKVYGEQPKVVVAVSAVT